MSEYQDLDNALYRYVLKQIESYDLPFMLEHSTAYDVPYLNMKEGLSASGYDTSEIERELHAVQQARLRLNEATEKVIKAFESEGFKRLPGPLLPKDRAEPCEPEG